MELWDELNVDVRTDRQSIVVGNLNMSEMKEDKTSLSAKLMSRQESSLWEKN